MAARSLRASGRAAAENVAIRAVKGLIPVLYTVGEQLVLGMVDNAVRDSQGTGNRLEQRKLARPRPGTEGRRSIDSAKQGSRKKEGKS